MNDRRRAMIVAWVGQEILPHEAHVRAWLRRMLDPDELEDVIQQAYAQIAALSDVSHILSGRAYFFATARSIILMQVRRARVVRIETMAEMSSFESVGDEFSPERITMGRDQLAHVRQLIDALPGRCGKIIKLRKIDGLSQRQVAEMLGVSENIVENDVAKGLKLILQAMADGERDAERRITGMRENDKSQASITTRDR
ncbi:MAG TPA: RNA polymerase sigma factor [Sphingopyxis sp.]|nr:RNA polymerase sigma factor [Sphingopyxis sp.]